MAFKLLNKKEDEIIPEIKKAVENSDVPNIPSIKNEDVKIKQIYQVVEVIPTQEIRKARREDGVIVNFITKEEAEEMINARTV